MHRTRLLLAAALVCASGVSALPFRLGATLDYTVVRDSGRATTTTSLRMLDSLHTDSGTVWSVAIRDSVHETGLVRQDTALVRRAHAHEGSDSLVVWDRPSCLAAWEPEPYRSATASTLGSGGQWWSIATRCFERGMGRLGNRTVGHDTLPLRPLPQAPGYQFVDRMSMERTRWREQVVLGGGTTAAQPALRWLPDTGWSGVQDDIYGESWILEKVDGQALPASQRWNPSDWRFVGPHSGEEWIYEMTWERSMTCIAASFCDTARNRRLSGQALVRLEVLAPLPDSAGWKGWRLKYRFDPIAVMSDSIPSDSLIFALRQHSAAPWQRWEGSNPWGTREYSSMPDLRGMPEVVHPLPALISTFVRMPDDSAFPSGNWQRKSPGDAWIETGVGLDTARLLGEVGAFSPWAWSSTANLRLIAYDGFEIRSLAATRAPRLAPAPALARLASKQVRPWLARMPGILSLRAISVAGRAVELDPRAPESGLARLHGLYTLEARSANEVKRAVLLGM